MSSSKVQGQSAHTPFKESCFQGLFEMNLAVHRGTDEQRGHHYQHFDLNAGCGHNHDAGCEGSPLAFLHAACNQRVELYNAHFVDHDEKAISELAEIIEPDDRCHSHCRDNAEFVKTIPDWLRVSRNKPRFALGMVVCDPNGTTIPVDALDWLMDQCQRLDLLINYPARGAKRARGAGCDVPYLNEMLPRFHKKHWHIQEPLPGCAHDWMILIGRNFLMRDWSSARLHLLDSPKGRAILQLASYTKRELTRSLFEDEMEVGQ